MEIIRDIKDENILVNLKTGNLAIIDFGSGCHANQDPLREFEGRHEYMYVRGGVQKKLLF